MSCDFAALSQLDASDPEQFDALVHECTMTLLSPELWMWSIAFTVVGAAGGYLIGKKKNAVERDVVLGAFLGPIGWLISFFLPKKKPTVVCRVCQKKVEADKAVCDKCGAALPTSADAPPR